MQLLDFETIKKLMNNFDQKKYYDWIDFCFRHKSEFLSPVKTRIEQDGGNYFAIMPCLFKPDNIAMVKMIGRHFLQKNEKRTTMMSDMLLCNANTGILKAVMDGEYITTIRTGACAAYSALLYAKRGFQTIGLIGLGNIMSACMDVFFEKTKNMSLTVKLFKHHDQEIRFKERYQKYTNIKFIYCNSYKDTIKDSDIIFSAVTRVTHDFCNNDCYNEGCTVVPIMTMGFQNCDQFFDHIYTDEINQIRGFKYFNSFKAVNNTSDVLLGKAQGRKSQQQRILVYNYGLSILDLYFADKILQLSDGIGKVPYRYSQNKYFM